jgi:hypothetical protein
VSANAWGVGESFADRAALSFTDRNIGVVLEGLQSAGFAETTIVALWADHVRRLAQPRQCKISRLPRMEVCCIETPGAASSSDHRGTSLATTHNTPSTPTLVRVQLWRQALGGVYRLKPRARPWQSTPREYPLWSVPSRSMLRSPPKHHCRARGTLQPL